MSALTHSPDPTAQVTGDECSRTNASPAGKFPLIVLIVFVVALGTCLYSPSAIEQLLLGWLYFPLRTAPLATVDWPSLAVGATCTLAFLVGLHWTLRWLTGHFAARATGQAPQFRLRTTLALAIAVLLLFASGTSMVGASHQMVWLITGRTTKSAQRPGTPPVHGLISDARTAARRSQQKNNLRQIGLAIHNFHEAFSTLPPGGTIDDHGRLMHGWAIYVGGFVSYTSWGIDFNVPWNEPPNDRLYRCAIPYFINPSIRETFDQAGYGLSHVAGNVHVLPISRVPLAEPASLRWDALTAARTRDDAPRRSLPLRMADIHDGTSNTILIGESAGNFRPWGHPANVRDPALGVGKSLDGFGGPPDAGGALFLMVDGAVRFISDQVDGKVIRALGTPAGGEAVDLDSR